MSFSTGLKNKSPTAVQRTQTSQTKNFAFTVNILTQTGSTVIPIQADKTRNATDNLTTPMGFFPCYIFWTHLTKDSFCSAGQRGSFTCQFLLYLAINAQLGSSKSSCPCTSLQIKIWISALDS